MSAKSGLRTEARRLRRCVDEIHDILDAGPGLIEDDCSAIIAEAEAIKTHANTLISLSENEEARLMEEARLDRQEAGAP